MNFLFMSNSVCFLFFYVPILRVWSVCKFVCLHAVLTEDRRGHLMPLELGVTGLCEPPAVGSRN